MIDFRVPTYPWYISINNRLIREWIMGLFDIFKNKEKPPPSPPPPPLKKIPQEILEKQFDEVLDEFVEGKYSKFFSSNLLLKKDERLIFDCPEVQLCEDKVVKSGGGYMGFSVRVMKGVSMRFGGFQGGVEKQVSPIDEGNFNMKKVL